MQKGNTNTRKHKNWIYYKELSFLIPHVELYRLDDSKADNFTESVIRMKENDSYLDEATSDEKQIYFVEEDDGDGEQVTYQIKINDDYEDEPENQYEEEERLDGTIIEMDDKKLVEKYGQDEYLLLDDEEPNEPKVQNTPKVSASASKPSQELPSSPAQRNIVDPDERYLLSCLPAFKRFTPKQKAAVRMGIEKLFYEVEFEDIDDPKSKRRRNS